jgi:hypothetical protein
MATYKQVFDRLFREQLPQLIQNFRFSYQQSDSFISWITGFDIIGITLIIANTDKIKETIGRSSKVIVILLLASIILGIIYKLMSLPMLARLMQTELDLKIHFTDEIDMEHEQSEIEKEAYNKEVTKYIEDSFGATPKWKKFLPDVNKKLYPRGYYLSMIFYGSVFLTLIALVIMVCDYIF